MPDYRKTPEAVAALTPEQFRVTQQSATERPGTGEYLDNDVANAVRDGLVLAVEHDGAAWCANYDFVLEPARQVVAA